MNIVLGRVVTESENYVLYFQLYLPTTMTHEPSRDRIGWCRLSRARVGGHRVAFAARCSVASPEVRSGVFKFSKTSYGLPDSDTAALHRIHTILVCRERRAARRPGLPSCAPILARRTHPVDCTQTHTALASWSCPPDATQMPPRLRCQYGYTRQCPCRSRAARLCGTHATRQGRPSTHSPPPRALPSSSV